MPKGVTTAGGGGSTVEGEPRVPRDPPTKAPPFPVAQLGKDPGLTMCHPLGNVLVTTDPPEAEVVVSGEFDLATTSTLTALLSRAVGEGCREFRIDMGGVTFCDASVIGLLVDLDRRLRSEGGSLTVVRASTRVLRLVHILGLDRLLGTGSIDRDLGQKTLVLNLA